MNTEPAKQLSLHPEGDAHLSEAEFILIQREVRRAWRALGMANLSITNDIDLEKNSYSPAKKQQIKKQVLSAKNALDDLLFIHFDES